MSRGLGDVYKRQIRGTAIPVAPEEIAHPEISPTVRDDTRYLGRILGEVIREQEGDYTFNLIENTRSAAFDLRYGEMPIEELAEQFNTLPTEKALPVIRAFSHFALMANLAEDLYVERVRDLEEDRGNTAPRSTLAYTWQELHNREVPGEKVAETMANALVAPVLTAHPTETRRRTVFDV